MIQIPNFSNYLKRFKNIIIVIIFILLIFLSWLFLGENNGMRYFSIHQEMSLESAEMQILRQENENLKKEIFKLKNDTDYQEEIARRKYDFLKKNEMVFDFSKPKK